jgi:peptidoglycan hydrolase CwlO-like protein
MIAKSTTPARLCPNCANSIEEGAAKCFYCKADLSSDFVPQWLKRGGPSSEPRDGSNSHKKSSIPSKFIWPAAMLLTALIAFFAGAYIQRSWLSLSAEVDSRQLQAKDQMIQSQEEQLKQLRQQLNENSNQLAELKGKLEESQKDLSATQQRLKVATRQVDRLNASRSVAVGRTASRAPDTAPSSPAAPASSTAASGTYETTRPTSVYEHPSSASRVLSQIGRGTRINVVSTAGGEWLQVRSKHGNPPGYVRSDDARPIGRAN